MILRDEFYRNKVKFLGLAAAAVTGILIGIGIPLAVDQSLYRLSMIVLGALMMLGIMVVRSRRKMLVVFLVLAIPLNLAFTPFGDPAWHSGGAQEILVIYLYDVPLIALLAVWGIEILWGERKLPSSRAGLLAVLFVFWSLLSIYNSVNHSLTLLEVLRMVKLALLALIITQFINTRRSTAAVFIAFMIGLLMQSLFAWLQYAHNFDLGGLGFTVGDVRRVSGTVGWPNTLGAWAAAVLCIPVALWICGTLKKYNPLLIGVIALGVVPLALSFSRGAWVAFGVGVPIMYLIGLRRGWVSWGRFVVQVSVLLIATVLIAGALAEGIDERQSQDTLSVRQYLNDIAINMTKANPVLGVGLNTFVPVMRQYDPRNVYAYFPEPVHNVFLLMMAETGVVGLGLFLAMVALVLWRALWVVHHGDQFLSTASIALIGGVIVILVSNLSDVHLRTDVIYATFWVFVGLILALRRQVTTESTSTVLSVR